MPRTKEQLMKSVLDCGVIAVIRAPNAEILIPLAEALLEGGITAIEVTMSTPRAIYGIELLANKLGDQAVVGVGTVLDASTARDAIGAGADFAPSPHFDPEVVAPPRNHGKLSAPGAFTPPEILTAWTAGADMVKLFPSTTLGPGYIKDLLAPLPQLKLTPTGGVDAKNASDWIRAGAVCVGAGSSLITKDAMAKKDWAPITPNPRPFLQAIPAPRGK